MSGALDRDVDVLCSFPPIIYFFSHETSETLTSAQGGKRAGGSMVPMFAVSFA